MGLPADRAYAWVQPLLGSQTPHGAAAAQPYQSRFPHAESLPDRPALDELLRKAEIPLKWHAAVDMLSAGYAPPSRGTGLTRHTSTLRRMTTATLIGELGPEAQSAQRFKTTCAAPCAIGGY